MIDTGNRGKGIVNPWRKSPGRVFSGKRRSMQEDKSRLTPAMMLVTWIDSATVERMALAPAAPVRLIQESSISLFSS
jgi:hypothetical protein